MLCMNGEQFNACFAAMASTNPELVSMLAQHQQNQLNAAASASLQGASQMQQQAVPSNSTSPLQQNTNQQMMPVGLKQMSNPTSVNSSAPNSQKPSFNLASIGEVEMMKMFHQNQQATLLQQQNQSGLQQPQPQKLQSQFLLATAQFGDKNGKETNLMHSGVQNHQNHQNPSSITPNQHQLSSPASSTAPQQSNNQMQQNVNPHLKRSQPQQSNMLPFNMTQNYPEHLLASMNGPPPAKRHSISAVPPSAMQNQQQTLTQHPLASLPMLYGANPAIVAALHPQLAAAQAQAQAQVQHLNGMAKTTQPPSILSLPTIPPSLVATTQPRINGEQNQLNGLAAAGVNAQMLGLPEGLNLNQLQLLLQARMNGNALQGVGNQQQAQMSVAPQQQQIQAPQPQQPTQNQSLQNQNMTFSAYQNQVIQMMNNHHQKNPMAIQALQNPQAQAFAAMQQSASPAHQLQVQMFLQQQQIQQMQQAQHTAANAALVAEQQRRRATIGNPAQLSAAMSAATQQQMLQNSNTQQSTTQQQQNPAPLGAQLAALMSAAQKNSPLHPQQNTNGQEQQSRQGLAPSAHSNNSPTTSQQTEAQPPQLRRISPPGAQNQGMSNDESNVQKLLAQMSSALDPQNQNQQAFIQQFNAQQEQLAQQNRMLQLQRQFADAQAQASTSSLLSHSNPAISTSNTQLTTSALQQMTNSQQFTTATSFANQLMQQQIANSQVTMANQLSQVSQSLPINPQPTLAHPMAQHPIYPNMSIPNTTLAQSINNQLLQQSVATSQFSNGHNGTPQNGTPASQQNGQNGSNQQSPLNANKSSPVTNPFTPSQQQSASNRESTSTEPCLVIADDEENPVVD